MAGSFGMETPQGEHRYRLSFTVGGLLATQGRTLAEMYLKHVSDNGGQPDPNRENREIGEAITMIRAQAIEENVLAIRTVTASKRIVAETLKRLSVLAAGGAPARMTPIERLAAFAALDLPLTDIQVFHTDRGGEFDNTRIDELLRVFGVKRSLSRKGDPYDNAVVESTNRLLKKELVYRNHCTTIERLRRDPDDYVWWSDNQRLHSALGYRSPKEFTEQGLVL